MESRKREAENPDENHFDAGVENEKWSEASPEEIESRRIVKVNSLSTNKEEVHINPFLTTTFPSAFTNTSNEPFKAGFGFQSYSNINPFAAIKSSAFPSNQLSSSFSADSSSSSIDKNSASASSTATAPATSILIPSPKSHNPFSTPSPVQNPFMSFIDNKSTTTTTTSNPWAAVTSTTASALGTGGFSSISGNTSTFGVASNNSFGTSNASSSSTSINNTESKTTNKTEDADDNENDQNNNDENVEEEVSSGVYGKIYQLPENVVVLTGEEDEECVLQMRAKLYKLQTRSSIGSASSSVTPTITSADSTTAPPKTISDITTATANEKESTIETDMATTADTTTATSSTTTTKATTTATTQPQVDWVEVGVGPVKILRKEIIVTAATASSSGNSSAVINSTDDDNNINNKNTDDNDNGDSSSSNVNKKSKVQQQSHRLVLRRESNRGGPGTKLLLNVALKSYVTIAKAGDKMFRLSCIGLKDENSTEYVPCTYLFKTSSNQESENLFNTIKAAINSCI